MTHDLDAVVRRALAATGREGGRFRLLELVRREPDADGRAALVFVDDEPRPRLFLKLGSGRRARALEIEHANLERLQQSADPLLRAAVPEPVALDRWGDFRVLAVTALPGTRMKDLPPGSYFGSRRFLQHLEQVEGFVRAFRAGLDAAALGPLPAAAAAVEAYRAGFRRSAALERLLDRSVRRLEDTTLPPSPWHGDFCTANLLIGPDESLRVVDWELPLERGWPLADLLYFASSVWCAPYGKGVAAREANFEATFFTPSPLADRLSAAVDAAASESDLDSTLVLPLSVLAWVAYANRKRQALSADAGTITDDLAAQHFPLVVVRDGRCQNLEQLAAAPEAYRPGRASP